MSKGFEIAKGIASIVFLIAVLLKLFVPSGPSKVFLAMAIVSLIVIIFVNLAKLMSK